MVEKKSGAKGKRGRPRKIDREEVARVALELFEQQGYEQVTMNDVAEAAEVSRRSLFRLFPSKSELVWVGIWESLAFGKESVAALEPSSLSLPELIQAVLVPGFELLEDAEFAAFARRRLLVINSAPSVFNHQAVPELQEFLAETIRVVVTPQTAPPELIASSLVSIVFGALLWWAREGGEMAARDALMSALSVFADVHQSFVREESEGASVEGV